MSYYKSKEQAGVSKMPPLFHTLPNEEFDVEKSEVVEWLSKKPDLVDYLFSRIRKFKDVIYNPETGKWQGIDYESEDE